MATDNKTDINTSDENNMTPLHWAAAGGKAKEVFSLIKRGANIDSRDKNGCTPLHWAAEYNETPETISILVNAGADVNAGKNSTTPLQKAALKNKNPEVISTLINAGADVNEARGSGRMPLFTAARFNPTPEITFALIQAGADVNAINERLETPLHVAVKWNQNPEIAAILIGAGSDVNAKNENGEIPLHFTAISRSAGPSMYYINRDRGVPTLHLALIYTLIDAGANVNTQNEYGWTPLHAAAAHGTDPAFIRVLLAKGANPKIKNNDGDTAYDLVRKNEKIDSLLINLLLKFPKIGRYFFIFVVVLPLVWFFFLKDA